MDRLSTKGQMIDQIDLRGVPHSGFDRSNHNYGTGKLGVIIPTRLDEVYPGDRIKGRPQDVTNFEPLAAPLMGSMVLKQEAFFVPYIQLWRHAYKFFTGKNGFDENMPTVSPLRIWTIFYQQIHLSTWCNLGDQPGGYDDDTLGWLCSRLKAYYNGTGSYAFINNTNFINDLISMRDHWRAILHRKYDDRKMYDLAEPALSSLNDFIEHGAKEYPLPSYSSTPNGKKNDLIQISLILGNIAKDFFNYFHGPSSIFDYLGWCVPIVENYDISGTNPEILASGVSNIFQVVVYNNILGASDLDFFGSLNTLFSDVPLVFNPFKAYYLIWYWNYRDQLLETDILDPEEDEFLGSTITDNVIMYCCILRHRCWFKDTFTTALTNTGSGNMLVPAQTIVSPTDITYYDSSGQLVNTTDYDSAFNSGATVCKIESDGIDYEIPMNYLRGSFSSVYNSDSQLSGSNAISLDLFDRVRRLREYVQKRLILGYEVDDVVYSSFMVRMSNVRMHIPEILGQGRDAVLINTIVNNTSTSEQIAGDKTATAYVHGSMSEMNYFSEEWGLYLQFKTIMPIQSYAGGMQRLYLKTHPLDYMWPEFATMGMDAVYNCELAALGTRLTDEQGLQVFGYQGRYYDLKSRMDEEHGRLLTDLNYLTFSREWDKNNPPKLNYMFVHCFPRLDGFVVNSPLEDVFRYDCYNAQAWERRLPVPSEIVG